MTTTYKYMKMKNLKLLIILLIIPLISFSQSLFEKYEDLDEVTTVVVTKSAFRLMGKIGGDSKEASQYIEDVRHLDNLAIYTTDKISIAKQMQDDVKTYLAESNLSELFRVKDKDGNVKIYVKEGKDDQHIKELFMFIENIKNTNVKGQNPNAVIVSITGDIDLEKVGRIIEKMNVPGGQHIKTATK